MQIKVQERQEKNMMTAQDSGYIGPQNMEGNAASTFVRPIVLNSTKLNLKPASNDGICSCVCINNCSCDTTWW